MNRDAALTHRRIMRIGGMCCRPAKRWPKRGAAACLRRVLAEGRHGLLLSWKCFARQNCFGGKIDARHLIGTPH